LLSGRTRKEEEGRNALASLHFLSLFSKGIGEERKRKYRGNCAPSYDRGQGKKKGRDRTRLSSLFPYKKREGGGRGGVRATPYSGKEGRKKEGKEGKVHQFLYHLASFISSR